MKIKELRRLTGMSQSEFAAYFGLSVRSVQEWEQERKQPPPYLVGLLKRMANRNKWLKTHIQSNNLYDVLRLKTVEECNANLPSKMILARYFYTITEICVSSTVYKNSSFQPEHYFLGRGFFILIILFFNQLLRYHIFTTC